MNLMQEIKKRSDIVNSYIDKELIIKKPNGLYESSGHLFRAGGKRIRAVIPLLVAEALNGNEKDILPLAAGVEFAHTFTLIHDDIMDNDDTRRGVVTVHKKWGISKAILAGDVLQARAFELLTNDTNNPERKLECVKILSRVCTEICEGQWMDIDFEKREIVAEDEYLTMIQKKTAVLFGAAAKIGAVGAGAPAEIIDALYEYGRLIGLAFQSHDDVLGLTGTKESVGKPIGSDLLRGKKTLIAIHALNSGVKLKTFGKEIATKKEIEIDIKVLKDSGSIKYAEDFTKKYISQAKEKLATLKESEAKEILLTIADYVGNREK